MEHVSLSLIFSIIVLVFCFCSMVYAIMEAYKNSKHILKKVDKLVECEVCEKVMISDPRKVVVGKFGEGHWVCRDCQAKHNN